MISRKVQISEDSPTKRSRHSVVVKGGSMYLFGGTDDSTKMNDTWELNLTSLKWKKIDKAGSIPSKRSGHSACYYGECMIIFGGYDFSSCDDMYLFSFKTNEWKKVTTYGNIPEKRNHHSAQIYQDCMVIFGGHGWSTVDGTNIFFNDTYILDFKNFTWRELVTTGEIPCKRFDHVSVIYHEKMYIFGGEDKNYMNDLYALDLQSLEWKLLETLGDKPSKRAGHKAVLNKTMIPSESCMIIFGGYDSNYSNDMYSYNFSTGYWKRLDIGGIVPAKRYDHSMVIHGDKIFIFGGNGEITLLNDVYCLEFDGQSKISLSNLLEEKSHFQDFTIHCDGRKYLVHRCILSQSKFFEEFFHNSKEESIQLNEKQDIVQEILVYLYSGETPELKTENFVDLIQLAKKWKLEGLETLLISKFQGILSPKNAFDLLTSAFKQGNQYLINVCIQYYHKNTDQFSKEDKFKLEKEILIELLEGSKKPVEAYHQKKSKNLYEHLCDLYQSKDYSDVILVSHDQVHIKAHRALISTLSEYFAIMLKNSFLESSKSEIHLDGLDGETLDIVLRYIYTKHLANLCDVNIIMKLIKFSDFAVMKDLYQIAVQTLLSCICSKNAIEIYEFTLEFEMDERIKQKCLSVIQEAPKDNLIDIILSQQEQIKMLKDQLKLETGLRHLKI